MSIICGTDLSTASADALEVARALAKQRGDDEVVLVHIADAEDAAVDRARAELDRLVAGIKDAPAVRAEIVVGKPEEALVNFAETEGSDLIVIASRSDGISNPRLGTTAARLIAHTTVPIVVLRDPKPWLAYARNERPLRLLLGIDDSATCDLGIQWTHALRTKGPVEVVLGAIYYPDDAGSHYGLDPKNFVDRDLPLEALITRDLLRRFGGDANGVNAVARPGAGRIGDHVLELAKEEKVDAIVVGTGQKTGLGRLGSVSSVIVNDARQSVVCVPPQATISTVVVPRLRTALVATDLSPFANRAIAYAFAMTPADGEVHLVHVLKDDGEGNEAEIAKQLRALAPQGSTQTVHAHVVRGDDAAIMLAQSAARHGVDVICISSHGRTGIARALVGSVADRLLRATRLPVLVLRPA
ncbi:MAG: universal stress protein [Deltaproteobacteria bacterium]|nr:universal stress protein [Deltaproteobacteria bacterium]